MLIWNCCGFPARLPAGVESEVPSAAETPARPEAAAGAGELCLDCGLCCNGVLFDQVKLQRGDNAKALSALGLPVKKKSFFAQPCAGLCGTLCRVYESRPVRCREFVCALWSSVQAGKTSLSAGRRKIESVRIQVNALTQLLEGTAGNNRRKPLAQRVATALQHPGAEALPPSHASALQEAFLTLQSLLDQDFRCIPSDNNPPAAQSQPAARAASLA